MGLLPTSPLWVWPKSLFSEQSPRPSPCPPGNTLEVHKTFQEVTTDPPEPSPEDTPSPPKSRTPMNVTALLMSRSKTDVPPCLVSPEPRCTHALTLATTTSSTPSPTL